MADVETEAEWAKMRSIEKERQKAVKNSEKAEPDLSALSYLDPKPTKVKGFSKDINVIMMTVEKFANISVVFVVAGVVLGLIGGAGEAVSSVNHLGMGGALIAGLPQILSILCLGIAAIAAITGIISSLWVKTTYHTRMSHTFFISLAILVILGIYLFVR